MKKLNIGLLSLFISACTTSLQDSSQGIYDMKTLQEYNVRVNSGNTVDSAVLKNKMTTQNELPMQLNASDTKPKVETRTIPVVPTIGVGYYHGFRHHHW